MSALVALVALAGCAGADASYRSSQRVPNFGTVLDGRVPEALLSLPFVDSTGRRVTLASLRGRVVVVSDMMTLCQETCAIGTAGMLAAARAVDRAGLGSKVVFLSITIDPARDDVRHLAAYRRLFGAIPNWRTVTGDASTVDTLWDRMGVWRRQVPVHRPYPRDWVTGRPLTTDIQHTDDLIFIGPDQRFRFEMEGPAALSSRHEVPGRIYSFMNRQGHQNVRQPDAGAWSAHQVTQVLSWLWHEGSGR